MLRLVQTGSLFLLLLIVALRPLISESYDSSPPAINQALAQIDDPSPLRTLVFDVLILVAGIGWAVTHAMRRDHPYRRVGLEWGLLILVVAAGVSCAFAGDKRLAINASIDWLCFPVAAIVLAQLMRSSWHRKILLAVILASACAQAVECYDQYYFGFADTWQHYQHIKADFWGRQGVALESSTVALFEHRMQAREASGLLPHSGIAGSYLVLCAMASLGLTLDLLRRAGDGVGWFRAVAAGGGTVLLSGAVLLTGSTGAIVSSLVGLALWAVIVLARRWIDRNRTKALWMGGLLALGVCSAVVGHGLYHGSLPRGSLGFRWRYWESSAQLIVDYGLTGVGRENFGRHYLQYKGMGSPEEIATPHNFLVQAASEWGVLGLAGISTMLVCGLVAVAGRRRVTGSPCPGSSARGSPKSPAVWALALFSVIVLARIRLLGTSDPSFVYWTSVMVGIPWLIGFLCYLGPRFTHEREMRAVPQATYTGVAIGLFTFVLHDLISFALFVPGAAMTFFALLAWCFSHQHSERSLDSVARTGETAQRCARWPVATLSGGLIAVVLVGLMPVARSAYHRHRAMHAGQEEYSVPLTNHPTLTQYNLAALADPLDPTPLVERAQWLVAQAANPAIRDEALAGALESMTDASKRDPWSTRYHRLKMQILRIQSETTGDAEALVGSVEAARAVLDRYPINPLGLIDLADCELAAGQALADAAHLSAAIEHYQRALDLDMQRPEWEVLRCLSPNKKAGILTQIELATNEMRKLQPID